MTFNTDGFNFDFAFFADGHANELHHLVQLLGRCCGHRAFCKTMKVVLPRGVYEFYDTFVRKQIKILAEGCSQFDRDTFAVESLAKRIKKN